MPGVTVQARRLLIRHLMTPLVHISALQTCKYYGARANHSMHPLILHPIALARSCWVSEQRTNQSLPTACAQSRLAWQSRISPQNSHHGNCCYMYGSSQLLLHPHPHWRGNSTCINPQQFSFNKRCPVTTCCTRSSWDKGRFNC
jgi:hypothetical protein